MGKTILYYSDFFNVFLVIVQKTICFEVVNKTYYFYFSCFSPAESAEGCCDVSNETQLQMNIDSDRELARIHSLIVEHMDRVQSIISKLNI